MFFLVSYIKFVFPCGIVFKGWFEGLSRLPTFFVFP